MRESDSAFVLALPPISDGDVDISWEATAEVGTVRSGRSTFRIATPVAPPEPPVSVAPTGNPTPSSTAPLVEISPSTTRRTRSTPVITSQKPQNNPSTVPSAPTRSTVTPIASQTTPPTRGTTLVTISTTAPPYVAGVAAVQTPRKVVTPTTPSIGLPTPDQGPAQDSAQGNPTADTLTLDGSASPTAATLPGTLRTTPEMTEPERAPKPSTPSEKQVNQTPVVLVIGACAMALLALGLGVRRLRRASQTNR